MTDYNKLTKSELIEEINTLNNLITKMTDSTYIKLDDSQMILFKKWLKERIGAGEKKK